MLATTPEQFIALRKQFGYTQSTLADRLGMSLRAVQDIESGKAKVRKVHSLAMDRIAIMRAAFTGDATLLTEEAVTDVLALGEVL
ncbi:helix-turn-helix domain-containing protein [Aureimonas leprariae]|uniref:Helix-turn-helix transcriptional regulator n=1 Tax=Plantimonas leprariae TaxID=2615207 RepID=A0A7V7PSB9_9HYPH|nr:helix-turn-helix transcriptional regulator [Aureimonas leprariae]KAB0682023.1 helix-turn-helix transcriptional regulator [Aureimonas leprariae]